MSNRVRRTDARRELLCTNRLCDSCWMDEEPERSNSEKLMEWFEKNKPDPGATGTVTFMPVNPGRLMDDEDRSDFEIALNDVFDEARQLLLRKHNDYGPRNIGDAPGGPLNGLLVRMWDKMARLRNLVEKGVEPSNESVRDSYLDLMNYAAIALMVIDDNWPKE